MLKAFSRASAPFVFATAALSLFAVHCSSDDGTPTGTAGTPSGGTAGSGGSATGGSATGGGGSATGGSATGGSAAGGGGSAAGGSAGAAAGGGAGGTATGGGGGAGGSAAGSGGAGGAGGSGGAGGAGGSGGAPGATFAQVKALLAASCSGGTCHTGTPHIDWKTDTEQDSLYTRLTTAIGGKGEHCKGSVPAIAGMPNESLLVQILKGNNPDACKTTGGQKENVDKMPNQCDGNGPKKCLTEPEIKVISDWIAGGAKK